MRFTKYAFLWLFLQTVASAGTLTPSGCNTYDNGEAIKYPQNQCDPFRLTDPNHAMHVMGGMLITTVGYAVTRRLGGSKFESVIIPWVIGTVAGMAKEVVFDEFTSGGNLVGNFIGLTVGSVLAISLDF